MVTGVVEYNDHAEFWRLLAQQSHEKALESHGVEDRTHCANELTAAPADGAETSHGLAGRRMRQSFFSPRLSADRTARLAGAAYVADNPFVEIVADIAALPGLRRIADANAQTRPDHPTGWRPGRSLVEFSQAPCNRRQPFASSVRGRPARSPRKASSPLVRSGSHSAAPWCRSRQTVRRLRGRIAPQSPAAMHAVDGRNATHRRAQSPAESLFALPQHSRSAICTSSFLSKKGTMQ